MTGYKGTQGRKAQPASVHKLNGTFRRDRHEKPAKAQARAKKLRKPPADLSPEVRAEWLDLVSIMEGDTLAAIDEDGLRSWATARVTFKTATAEIDRNGYLNEEGKASPYIKIRRDAEATLMRLFSEFGGTPAARNRLAQNTPGPPAEQERDLDAFLDSNPQNLN